MRVTTPVGTSSIVPAAQYTYEGVPTVTQVFPNAGLPAGGTTVQIAGTNFTDATAVYFGSSPAASFTVNSAILITAVSPAGTQGNTVDITVTTPVGTSATSSADQYDYEGTPTITAISPTAGLPAGGNTMVITGTNFTDELTVTFGTTVSYEFTVNSSTQVTVTVPAGTAGTTNVRVTTPVGTSPVIPAGQYTYEDVPTVTGVSPNAGLPSGGTSVMITGTNFVDASSVSFGGTAASSFTVNSATQITAVSPAGTEGGTVDITVTTPVGTSTTSSADQFIYENLPAVTGLSPAVGLPAGGTTVVITGTDFLDATAVNFGSTPATSFTINSATQITALSPEGTGNVNVTVTTPVGDQRDFFSKSICL